MGDKPARSAIECIRHDTRSAAHTLSGFLDLLQGGVLGALSQEQVQAIKHMEAAAERITELAESALELAEGGRRLKPSEVTRTCLMHEARHALYAFARGAPEPAVTFGAEHGIEQLPVQIEHERVRKLLKIVLELARSTSPAHIDVRLSRTDLHASLVLEARQSEGAKSGHPAPANAASPDIDGMAAALGNREYVRLKRVEALLGRHKGRLLVAPDLTRLRIMLPLAR